MGSVNLPKIVLITLVFTATLLATSPGNESIGQQAVLNLKKNLKSFKLFRQSLGLIYII